MLSENRADRNQMEMFCIDSFLPEDHLLRKIDEALDFGKIYEIAGLSDYGDVLYRQFCAGRTGKIE